VSFEVFLIDSINRYLGYDYLTSNDITFANQLPKKSFCLPDVSASKPNQPFCECAECGRIIDEVNFYQCPKRNCLIQPRIGDDWNERLLTNNDVALLHKLKKENEQLKKYIRELTGGK
jgi:hypothetical protein